VVLKQIATSPEEELIQDVLAVIHVFSSRLYGLRKYGDELKKLQNEPRLQPKKAAKILDEGE